MSQPIVQPLMRYKYRAGTGWGFMRYMDIPDGDRPTHVYLRRLIVFKTPLVGLYVHWIYTADNDRDPHNHPMPFLSFVFKGGYDETRFEIGNVGGRPIRSMTKRVRSRFEIGKMPRSVFHFITRLHESPTITVLLTGRRSPDGWGFLTQGGYVDQEEYRAQREAEWATQ